ncbi:ubiquitin related modifier (URM1) domain-containing protein [Pochonia chlamydosporia 170]|uniref:Ubiquitin-related modifier 1 n=1 Tax=Pochonia chlamydosporia 170 TaxID=1380566 RepID=A0A179FG61_METCM|nr:ubiquitin related modifier (URM1) domain-containing protein [Pochonia chlamydosporia 170]OAQ64524.1 ubiquitin related modifier (URM1) domain-containing protein [Pochonia chlamydosporia 170]
MAPTESEPISEQLRIDVEFSGGLEMLFADQRRHSLTLPAKDKDGQPANIAFLIDHLCQNVMNDTRKELFILDDHLYVAFKYVSDFNAHSQ